MYTYILHTDGKLNYILLYIAKCTYIVCYVFNLYVLCVACAFHLSLNQHINHHHSSNHRTHHNFHPNFDLKNTHYWFPQCAISASPHPSSYSMILLVAKRRNERAHIHWITLKFIIFNAQPYTTFRDENANTVSHIELYFAWPSVMLLYYIFGWIFSVWEPLLR